MGVYLIYPWSEARRLQRFVFFKYYNALLKFILELNAARNMDDTEKCFKQKLHGIKFAMKNSVDAYHYLPLEWSKGPPKICIFEIL